VKSANDAAALMGEFLAGGSEQAFADQMNAKAKEIGMRSTVFRNASGLPAVGAQTTAHDMAILARALHQRFPKYSEYFSRRYFQWGARTFRNTNRLLHARREVDGMKTGYTRASGYNLVATAQYREQKVILVVLGGRTSNHRYLHAQELLVAANRGLPLPPATENPNERDDDESTEHVGDEPPAKPTSKPGFSLVSRANAATREDNNDSATTVRYGINVGSFRSFAQARRAAKKAYYIVPDAYRTGSTRIAVIRVKYGRKTQFEARLLGFNQAAANQTCRHLARRGLPCRMLSYPLQTAERHKRVGQNDIAETADRLRPS
jgi:D-alanyl-D-alanine carboxypeptidase